MPLLVPQCLEVQENKEQHAFPLIRALSAGEKCVPLGFPALAAGGKGCVLFHRRNTGGLTKDDVVLWVVYPGLV